MKELTPFENKPNKSSSKKTCKNLEVLILSSTRLFEPLTSGGSFGPWIFGLVTRGAV
jgi:hypothetical protein